MFQSSLFVIEIMIVGTNEKRNSVNVIVVLKNFK